MKTAVILLSILILAFVMRFYNFYGFQYFSGDEEIFHALLRRIAVEGKPILTIPNAQVSSSIGSFFHLISSPFFLISNSNPKLVPIFSSLLGVVTTALMYWVGNLVAGRRMGLFAAFLYGGSFLTALFDRRLWPLTPDPLLILLGIGATIQILRQKFHYMLLFAVAVSFAWQADPTNTVILVGGVISFIKFRVPVWRKEYLAALVYLFFSILPLVIFEIRHPGTIFRPFIIHLFSRSTETQILSNAAPIQFLPIWENLSRFLFLMPSKFIEQYFCYCNQYPLPPFSPIPEAFSAFFIIFAAGWLFLQKKRSAGSSALAVVLIYLSAFLAGIISYSLILKYNIYQHYLVVAVVPFLLVAAFVLKVVSETRWAILAWIFIIMFLVSNSLALFNSGMRYPVWQKMALVDKLIPIISGSTFSVYGEGTKYFSDGGWTTFFIGQNQHPGRSYLNGGWDFIYRSHSLYTTNPDQGEGKKVIIFHDAAVNPFPESAAKIETRIEVGDMAATVLNNGNLWFDGTKYE